MKNFGELRISDLELLVTAARLGHLGKAAIHHHMSQSAASAAIQRVEKIFESPLSTHEKRRFSLTSEGKKVVADAERWLSVARHLFYHGESLPLRIATTHAIAKVMIGPLLPHLRIELIILRPDHAYRAVLRGEADLALILDNAPWGGLLQKEVSRGLFQLYSQKPPKEPTPLLLPEDRIEILLLSERWEALYNAPLPIATRIPSWSLIADLCATSNAVGFLPDFLAKAANLKPVSWQPSPIDYRLLALYKKESDSITQALSLWSKSP